MSNFKFQNLKIPVHSAQEYRRNERLVLIRKTKHFKARCADSSISFLVHSRQARSGVGTPRTNAILAVFSVADLTQIFHAVVGLVAIDVVNLRRKPAMHYCPYHVMQLYVRVLTSYPQTG